MMKLLLAASILVTGVTSMVQAAPAAEAETAAIVKREGLTVVHLWAPWCSNCQAELKSGGWAKMVQANPEVRFVFVSVWDAGDAGVAMLKKFEIGGQPNVTIVSDPGPRSGPERLKTFLNLPFTWIPTTWIYKTGELRYALNYGEVRFPVLQQFIEDSNSEWSHKGEN